MRRGGRPVPNVVPRQAGHHDGIPFNLTEPVSVKSVVKVADYAAEISIIVRLTSAHAANGVKGSLKFVPDIARAMVETTHFAFESEFGIRLELGDTRTILVEAILPSLAAR